LQGRNGVGGLTRSVGINDEYAARVGAMLLKEKAAPFTLVYFFKGDSIAHHHGLAAQKEHVAIMDRYVADMFVAAGGEERIWKSTRSWRSRTTAIVRSSRTVAATFASAASSARTLPSALAPDSGPA
jgi:hypothetical protein